MSAVLSFLLIFLAEMGDKSQLVCMTLAAKHKPKPVFFGALLAFMLLNAIAVVFAGTLATVLPMNVITAVAALLFTVFGLHSLLSSEEGDEDVKAKVTKGIFFSALLLIFVAELGDKTQLAIATLSITQPPMTIWLTSTLALALTTALGVFAGQKLLTKISTNTLHRVSGMLFLLFALFAWIEFFRLW
ncbi:TMEM165/GDT1 family protein [Thalassotalea aquiviva]|uniref:TMEM165/GDT1 family protein n=1 Tax=Thalassotalea aquiviva TaxID=3242415 RepID=UPI00352B0D5A